MVSSETVLLFFPSLGVGPFVQPVSDWLFLGLVWDCDNAITALSIQGFVDRFYARAEATLIDSAPRLWNPTQLSLPSSSNDPHHICRIPMAYPDAIGIHWKHMLAIDLHEEYRRAASGPPASSFMLAPVMNPECSRGRQEVTGTRRIFQPVADLVV